MWPRITYIFFAIGVCKNCVKPRPEEVLKIATESHKRARELFGLPPEPPRGGSGGLGVIYVWQ